MAMIRYARKKYEMTGLDGAIQLTRDASIPSKRYSICTLVTRREEYGECLRSFREKGFSHDDCEYLYIDNSQGNSYEAYAGYNLFLQAAQGKYIILCHQDVLLLEDGRDTLDRLLEELDRIDPQWGLCGNAGAKPDGTLAIRITDPNTKDSNKGGPFPARTVSLDENFIVVRKDANLALSRDLAGFHLYGTEMCIIADILGYGAYVIEFHLFHKSGGNPDRAFEELIRTLVAKYRRAFRSRWIYMTTRHSFYITASQAHRLGAKLRRKLLGRR